MSWPEKYFFSCNVMSVYFKPPPRRQENKIVIIKAIRSNIVPPRGGFFAPEIRFPKMISEDKFRKQHIHSLLLTTHHRHYLRFSVVNCCLARIPVA